MNRSDQLQKANIVREGLRTFDCLTREILVHKSFGEAKLHVRKVLHGTDGNGSIIRGSTSQICVTGKGVIAQMTKLLEIKDQREAEARARKAAKEKEEEEAHMIAMHKAGVHKSYDEACPLCMEDIASGAEVPSAQNP